MYRNFFTLVFAAVLLFPIGLLAQEDTVRFTLNVRRLKQAANLNASGSPVVGDTAYALIFSGATASGLNNPGAANRLGVFTNLNTNDSLFGPVNIGLGATNITQIVYKFVYSNATRAIPGAFPTGELGNIRYEDDPNKTVTFQNPTAAETVEVVRYWNDDPSQVLGNVTQNVTFRADMTNLIQSGFDDATDSVFVLGTFVGWDRQPGKGLVSEGFGSVTYSVTHTYEGEANSEQAWKFRAFSTINPSPFLDSGWEQGDNKRFRLGTTNDPIIIGADGDGLVPQIGVRARKSFNVRFIANTNGGRTVTTGRSMDSLRQAGALTGSLNGVPYGVYLAGGGVFEDWPNWNDYRALVSTSEKRYERMEPSANFGPGFFEVIYPVSFLTVGPYKFAAFYNGIDTTRANYLDNEAGFAINKLAIFNNDNVAVGDTFNVIAVWGQGEGSMSVFSNNKNGRMVEKFELSQNYPNPFNPSTTIRFAIPTASQVRLDIFNVLGQKVGTLVNSRLEAGTYTQLFNATNLSSGVYFYRLQAGSFNKTMKMMLVK